MPLADAAERHLVAVAPGYAAGPGAEPGAAPFEFVVIVAAFPRFQAEQGVVLLIGCGHEKCGRPVLTEYGGFHQGQRLRRHVLEGLQHHRRIESGEGRAGLGKGAMQNLHPGAAGRAFRQHGPGLQQRFAALLQSYEILETAGLQQPIEQQTGPAAEIEDAPGTQAAHHLDSLIETFIVQLGSPVVMQVRLTVTHQTSVLRQGVDSGTVREYDFVMSLRRYSGWIRILALALLASVPVWAAPACGGARDAGQAQGADEVREAVMDGMIEAIQNDARQTASYTGLAEISAPVIAAIRAVPRDRFVPEDARASAYANTPLRIGHGQTISQPFIVTLMTELLEPAADDRILEIGTGSGYQAAVLGELVDEVYSIEIVPELAETAAGRLDELGYHDVHVKAGDGWYGWPEAGPFDGIIVTAVSEETPPELLEQLAPGGRLVLPLGPQYGGQMLVVLSKGEDGSLTRRDVLPVQFVPLTGDH